MRLRFAIILLVVSSGSALAQYGITNQRDAQGNIVRDNGPYAQRGVKSGTRQ